METNKPEELVWTPEMIARFWNYEAQWPERYFSYQASAAMVEFFAEELKDRQSIVDYGAGPGYLIEDLLGAGFKCGGLEHSPTGVQRLYERFGRNPKFIGAWHIDDMSVADGRFDAAFLIEVVEHLYDSQLDAALAHVRGLLKPGGLLIVTTPNQEDRQLNMIMSPESGRLFHRWQHVRSWSAKALSDKLESSGFDVRRSEATNFMWSRKANWRKRQALNRLLRNSAMRAMKQLLTSGRRLPHLFAVAARRA